MDPRALARTFRDFTRAPFTQVPQAARGAWLRALEQLRLTLDLPSRRELADLTARLEALDARIGALATDRLALATEPATLPAPDETVAVLAADAALDADADDAAVDDAAAATGDPTVVGTNGQRRNRNKQARKNNRR